MKKINLFIPVVLFSVQSVLGQRIDKETISFQLLKEPVYRVFDSYVLPDRSTTQLLNLKWILFILNIAWNFANLLRTLGKFTVFILLLFEFSENEIDEHAK